MIACAIESSSDQAGVALFRDGTVMGVERYAAIGPGDRAMFEAVERLLRAAGVHLADVAVWIAGRGPGRYGGIRSALTAAQFFALPGHVPVYVISSAAALAAAVLRETGMRRAVIAGDARRGQIWHAQFDIGPERFVSGPQDGWHLSTPLQFLKQVIADAIYVSPDYHRLQAQGCMAGEAAGQWIPENRYPDAVELGTLALQRLAAGHPSEPPAPLYLHAAVAPS